MGAIRGIGRREFLKAGLVLCGGILAGPGYGIAQAFRTAPGLRIRSGDTVVVETGAHLSDGMVLGTRTEEWVRRYAEEMARLPRTRVLAASGTGPILVEDTGPGDILQVELLEIIPASCGYYIRPEPEDPESGPAAVAAGMRARWYRTNLRPYEFGFPPEVRIPLRPFAGALSVTASGGRTENLGCRELAAGTALYVPARGKRAGVTAGNFPFRKGCRESAAGTWEGIFRSIALRVSIRKDLGGNIPGPVISTPDHWVSLAVHGNPLEAGGMAARDAARFLGARYGMSPEEGRGHISTRAERRIEFRSDGAYAARVLIPKSAFEGDSREANNILFP